MFGKLNLQNYQIWPPFQPIIQDGKKCKSASHLQTIRENIVFVTYCFINVVSMFSNFQEEFSLISPIPKLHKILGILL